MNEELTLTEKSTNYEEQLIKFNDEKQWSSKICLLEIQIGKTTLLTWTLNKTQRKS